MDDSIYIIIYIILWAITFFKYWRKKRVFDAGSLIISSYLAYAVLSYFLYTNFYRVDGAVRELSLFPFIYLYSMLLIFLLPVMKFDGKCEFQQPSLSLFYVISSIILISAIVVIPFLLEDLAYSIIVILTTEEGGEELYYLSSLERGKEASFGLYNIFAIIFHVFSDFVIFLLFYSFTLPHVKKIVVIGLLFVTLISMLKSITAGGRTGITMTMLICIASFFLFRYKLPSKLRKTILFFGIGIAIFVGSILIVIGNSRYSSTQSGSDYYLLSYSGQAPLYFNKYGLDAGGIRYGDRTCNIFKKLLLFNNVPKNFDECRQKHHKMKLDDSQFSTFVGDFTLDFGPITTAFSFCLISFLMIRLTRSKNNTILFHQLILVFLIMSISITGGMYLFYYSFKGNYSLIGFIIMYLLFRWDSIRHCKTGDVI